ncbi:MAG: hypothetical protein WBF66_00165 [Dehalococcoidia bacterium]
MPRGGPRPGAGAPRGNLNALKHGLHSDQMKALALALAQLPLFRRYLQRLAARRATQRRELATAVQVLSSWVLYQRALDKGSTVRLPPPRRRMTKRGARLLARAIIDAPDELGETIKQVVRSSESPEPANRHVS